MDPDFDAVGRLAIERDAEDLAGVRLVPVVDRDEVRAEEDFVDLVLEAGDFCFVATGVRDSLVAPSARHLRWYRSDGADVRISSRVSLAVPDLRCSGGATTGEVPFHSHQRGTDEDP